uniref:CCHC-type domain-containing protein n=1 Tax=Oryza glumipatula TaxID=40148 RepID=A0A0E0AI42_9ORYZ
MPLIKAKRSIKGNPLIRIASQRKQEGIKASTSAVPLSTSPYCHFCASDGHWQRNCTRFTAWLVKKGNSHRLNGSKEGSEHSE